VKEYVEQGRNRCTNVKRVGDEDFSSQMLFNTEINIDYGAWYSVLEQGSNPGPEQSFPGGKGGDEESDSE